MKPSDPANQANEEKDGELDQDANTLATMTEAERQRQIADDAMYAEYERRRGRVAGQTFEPHTSATVDDLQWFVDKTSLDPDNVINSHEFGTAERKQQLNTLIIDSNETLDEPLKMDAMAQGLTRAQKETVIRDHIVAMRKLDAQYKATLLQHKAEEKRKTDEAYVRQLDNLNKKHDETSTSKAKKPHKKTPIPVAAPTTPITTTKASKKKGTGSEMKADGKGLTVDTIKDDGMTGQEIETVLKKKLHTFIPVIACDEIPSLCKYINGNTQEFGFIINSDPHNKSGCHWRSIYISRPKAEIDFYDSLTSEPTDECLTGLKILMNKMNDPLYYVLKINRVKYQSNTTSTCGAFALKFLDDMYHGKKFKEATGYDDHINGEKDINKYISRWNLI